MEPHSDNHYVMGGILANHESTKSQKIKYTKEPLRDLKERWRNFNIHLIDIPEKEKEENDREAICNETILRTFKS